MSDTSDEMLLDEESELSLEDFVGGFGRVWSEGPAPDGFVAVGDRAALAARAQAALSRTPARSVVLVGEDQAIAVRSYTGSRGQKQGVQVPT